MKLIISSVSGEPIYEQIKNQTRSAIMSGELTAGEALPSLRKLAKELRVSVLTVTRAYNELADEGLVENVQGKGTFVMERGNELMKERARERIMTSSSEFHRGQSRRHQLLDLLGMFEKAYRNNHERSSLPQGTRPTLALSVTGLTKHYDSGFTLDDVTFDLRPATSWVWSVRTAPANPR